MRKTQFKNGLSVKAIAGTNTVLFGLNIEENQLDDLLGFNIEKKEENSFQPLSGETEITNIEENLVQEFLWSDYTVLPGKEYEYRISALYAKDSANKKISLTIKIKTEDNATGKHEVYFNRGVAGSQAYSRNFGRYAKWYKPNPSALSDKKVPFERYIKPSDIPKGETYRWLSRGLEEALLGFIQKAKDESFSIRASIYELSYPPIAQEFVSALERGVDVKIIHHAKQVNKYKFKRNTNATTHITYRNDEKDLVYRGKEIVKFPENDGISSTAISTLGSIGIKDIKNYKRFQTMLIGRTKMAISHNKFIILLKDGKPIEVWTGSTNLTYGGLFGQSNVGHIVKDENVASNYFNYWKKLSEDPKKKSTKKEGTVGVSDWILGNNPNLESSISKNSIATIFSPRSDYEMLQWYADKMKSAKNSIFFTTAFSMDKRIFEITKNKSKQSGDSFLRYLLLESKGGHMRTKFPDLLACKDNSVAWGEKRSSRKKQEGEFYENLTGLNSHVNFIHTKFLIIDALTDNPILITGSANFSEASTTNNDENMLVISGNTALSDIYLTEFMRLFNHFKRRNKANETLKKDSSIVLKKPKKTPWFFKHFKNGTAEFKQRNLFKA